MLRKGLSNLTSLANPGCDPGLLIVKPLRGLVGNYTTVQKLKASGASVKRSVTCAYSCFKSSDLSKFRKDNLCRPVRFTEV
jgi:hypothetical protein